MNAPPLSQTQVQFPIIDDLADDFAILIAGVNRKVHFLSASRLQGLKALFEEKLKSKGAPITIPSSADKLMNFISQYWDYLSFEFAQLVVRYLGKEDLQEQLQRYEEKLRRKGEILLTQCREKNITPRAPPGCFSVKITVDEDPYSFSLHRILEFKDFLVHRIGMDIALFDGWGPGSIFLCFCILEDDMETAVRQLYAHKLELRAMQVVAIEVGDVIVYHDTPIAVSSKIHDLAVAMGTASPIVSKILAFGSAVSAVVGNVLGFLRAVEEEIKNIPQVKTALCAMKLSVEIASCLLDKVVDISYYFQSKSMKDAIQKLSCTPPDLNPLRDLLSLLGNTLQMAESKYSELVEACDVASQSCHEAAEMCARNVTDSQKKKGVTKGVSGTAATAGGIAAGGIAISVVTGALTFGMGTIVGLGVTAVAVGVVGLAGFATGVGTAVATDHIAKKYQESEDNFRRIGGEFDALLGFANELKEGVAQVHTTQVNISANVNNVKDSKDNESIALIKEALKRLKKTCTDTYVTTSECRDEVKSKMKELKSNVK